MPPTTLAALCSALVGEAGALDTRASLELDRRSGLPTLTAFLRARSRLQAREVELDRFDVQARVRRIRPGEADVRITMDRFDPTDSLFKRTTLELTSQGSRDVRVDGERAELSGDLRDTLYTYAGADPEILFLRLAGVPRIRVSDVTRGRTGPMLFAGVTIPQPLAPLFEERPDAMVLCCGTARVAAGLTGARLTDPLRVGLVDRLEDDGYQRLRAEAPEPYGTRSLAIMLCGAATAPAVRALPGKKTLLTVTE